MKLQLPKLTKRGFYSQYLKRTAVVTGYGYSNVTLELDPETNRTMETNAVKDNNLRFAETAIVDNKDCNRYYKLLKKSHLCARVKQRDADKAEGVCSVSMSSFTTTF